MNSSKSLANVVTNKLENRILIFANAFWDESACGKSELSLLGKYTGLIHSVQSPAAAPSADCGDKRSCARPSVCGGDELCDSNPKCEQHSCDRWIGYSAQIFSTWSVPHLLPWHLSSPSSRFLIAANSPSDTLHTTHLRIFQHPDGFPGSWVHTGSESSCRFSMLWTHLSSFSWGIPNR